MVELLYLLLLQEMNLTSNPEVICINRPENVVFAIKDLERYYKNI